jgi:hypothetical protein
MSPRHATWKRSSKGLLGVPIAARELPRERQEAFDQHVAIERVALVVIALEEGTVVADTTRVELRPRRCRPFERRRGLRGYGTSKSWGLTNSEVRRTLPGARTLSHALLKTAYPLGGPR